MTNFAPAPSTCATLKDVAKAAGVSAKTVSRVINNEKGVSEGKRQEIEAVIERLEFQPNRAAQALKGNAPKTLLLLAERTDSLYTLQILTGALAECRKAGVQIIVEEYASNTPGAGEKLASSLAKNPVGGVILLPPLCDQPDILENLARLAVRTVRISPRLPRAYGDIIEAEEAEGASAAAQHLYMMGHRRVSIILGMGDHAATQLRSMGFISGWLDAGGDTSQVNTLRLPVSMAKRLDGVQSIAGNLVDAGMEMAKVIFEQPDRPSAIFAFNDTVALGLMWGANERGLSIPKDVSIVGFDGNIAASLIRPRLTTVFMPLKQLGENAVCVLTRKEFRPALIATQFILGDTTRDVRGDR